MLFTIIKGRKKRKSDNKSELQEITLVSTLAISPVNLEDTGLYTCQSGFNSEANVTVIVISGKQMLFILIKGQIISKYIFSVFNSPKKPTKTIRLEVP